MNRESSRWREAPLALVYSVLTAILFGAVLTDVTYAAVLHDVLSPEQKQHVYGIVSDSMPLMLVGFLGVIVGITAAILAGGNPRARWLTGVSVVLLLGGNVLVPMLAPHLRVDDTPGPGTLLRIALHAVVVVLAVMAGLSWRNLRHS